MDKSSNRVSLNFTSILLGRGIGLFLNLFAVILAARSLGVAQYGLFTALLSVITILTKLIDFGFSPIITRELSKNTTNFSFLNTAISIRIILYFFLVVTSNIVFKFIAMPFNEVLYSNILFLNIIFSSRFLSFRELLEIPFKVNLKMHIVVLINFLDNFLLIFLLLFISFFEDKTSYFVVIFCISNIPGFIFLVATLHKNFEYKFEIKFYKAKWLIKESLPLMGYAIFLSIFQQLDVVLTKNFISETANGIYSAGIRLTIPLSVFPIAIVSTTLPLIISYVDENKTNYKKIISLVYKLLLILSFIFSILLSFKSKEIVLFLLGKEYLETNKVLIILVWSNLFLFYNFFTVELLTIFNKQKYNLYFAVLTVFVDLLLFFMLYKNYSYIGVAFSRLIATLIGTIFLKYVFSKFEKRIKVFNPKLFLYGFALFLISMLSAQLNIIIFIILIIFSSIILAVKLNVFNKFELDLILTIFRIKTIFPKLYSYLKK